MARALTPIRREKNEEPQGIEVAKVGKFAFLLEKGLEIPPEVPKAPRAVELPFKHFFEKAEHNDHQFVPNSFWTAPKDEGGRGVPTEKLNPGYIRSKLRGAFNDWKAKDEEGRKNRQLILVPRKKGDERGAGRPPFDEDGFSMFLQVNKEEERAE